MKLAVITQAKDMHVLTALGLGYNFALGQNLIVDIDYYRGMYEMRKRGSFIIVDNGAAEPENERKPFDEIVHAAMSLGADEIILPDKLYDSAWTLKHSLSDEVLDMVPYNKRMVVPQGRNWDEWIVCLNRLVAGANPVAIGVAKWLEKLPGGRPVALVRIKQFGYDKRCNIHLLGIHSKPFAEVRYAVAALPTIRGIDTGAPVAYAANGWRLDDSRHFSFGSGWSNTPIPLLYSNVSDYVRFCHEETHRYGESK